MMKIQQLSQQTGISSDTLRIWERRYGFPSPQRNAQGQRNYSEEQLSELQLVVKLQHLGQRPGKILPLTSAQRRELLQQLSNETVAELELLRPLHQAETPQQIFHELRQQRAAQELPDFIDRYAVPLLNDMDQRWTEGRLSIAREHLVSDQLERLLLAEIEGREPADSAPVLFVTLNGERHKLGLLLAAALFSHAGIRCLYLKDDLPLAEIPALVEKFSAAAVALSFSSQRTTQQAAKELKQLRRQLPSQTGLIAGGAAVSRLPSLPNLLICSDLTQLPRMIARHFNPPGR